MSNTMIPGLSFSLKRALGITKLKRQISTSKSGIERKLGATAIETILKILK